MRGAKTKNNKLSINEVLDDYQTYLPQHGDIEEAKTHFVLPITFRDRVLDNLQKKLRTLLKKTGAYFPQDMNGPNTTIDFSKIFHHLSKDRSRGHKPIPEKDIDWPEEWKTTYYKSYSQLPKIALSDNPPATDFFRLIKKRQSRRDFIRTPLSLDEISALLKYSCGNTALLPDGRSRRAYPSGGARFPIEIYLIIFRSGVDLKSGLYHYNVKEHALDVLCNREFTDTHINELFTYQWSKNAGVGIVMTSIFWRSQNKYGERGYRYILYEAGHIGQNVYLVSEALGLKCCALGGTKDENLEKLINIDGKTESVVYALTVGK